MKRMLKQTACCLLFATVCFTATAQKKELTNDQYFKNNFIEITQVLPVVTNWVDDNHFIIQKDGKKTIVDCKTGIGAVYTETEAPKQVKSTVAFKKNDLFITVNGVETQLTNDKDDEKNATISPDEKYVAFTKNNNLFTINISTKKETALTSDGSETILNGYASWVYTEEILGRASHYKSFWWSPDSKHIAYFRTDDGPVPVFTLADGNGQHGYVETMRYPKVGDANPAVKVGIVSPQGGNTQWADFNEKQDQYFGMPYWSPDGSALWVQWMNRLQNNLIIWSINPVNGSKKLSTQKYKKHGLIWMTKENELNFWQMAKVFYCKIIPPAGIICIITI